MALIVSLIWCWQVVCVEVEGEGDEFSWSCELEFEN